MVNSWCPNCGSNIDISPLDLEAIRNRPAALPTACCHMEFRLPHPAHLLLILPGWLVLFFALLASVIALGATGIVAFALFFVCFFAADYIVIWIYLQLGGRIAVIT